MSLNWDEPAERLLTSSLAHELISHALLSQVGARQGLRLKGGLARASAPAIGGLHRQSVGRADQPWATGRVVRVVGVSLCADVPR